MTRLLFPEAYGLMTLVWAVLYGLQMLSDVGLVAAIIRDKRGDDPDFLNTAWTVNVIRGAVLWVAACLVAYPMAQFYREPQLMYLIPVAGFTALVAGFQSMALHNLRRHMQFRRLTVLDVSNEVITFGVVVVWAYVHPTVWALVGGAVISQAYYVWASHKYLPGIRAQFRWEHDSLRVLMGFGKWIFLSSAVYFVSTQGDRILLGRYLDMTHLGIYGVAIMLSEAVQSVILKVNSGVLFPAYSRIQEEEPARLASVVSRARSAIDLAIIVPTAALMMLGSRVVEMLYDPRYHAAGWMLQVLCVRAIMIATLSNSESCLVALGRPQYSVAHNFFRAIWVLGGIPIGWSLSGVKGVVWAVALSETPVVLVIWLGMMRYRIFSLFSELRSLFFVGVGALIGLSILHVLP